MGLRGIIPLAKDWPDSRMALIRLKLVSWGEEEESEAETDMVEDSKWSDEFPRTVNPGSYKYVPEASPPVVNR